jgi:hypothetical protein
VTWVLIRRARACSRCHQPLEVGAQARIGRVVPNYVWCVRCAKSGLQEDPPEDRPLFEDLAPLAGSQRELPLDDLSAAIGRAGPSEDRQ